MLGKFSLDTMINYGGKPAGFFLILYLFTMIVMIMNFFVAILNDFLAAAANSNEMKNRDFEVMDHFVDTVKNLIVAPDDDHGSFSFFSLPHDLCRPRKVSESSEITGLRFPGLESYGKGHWSWKTLEKFWNSVAVLKILLQAVSTPFSRKCCLVPGMTCTL